MRHSSALDVDITQPTAHPGKPNSDRLDRVTRHGSGSELRTDLLLSLTIATAVAGGAGWLAYLAVDGATGGSAGEAPFFSGSVGEMWLEVMASNFPVFIALVSGIATFGLGSLLSLGSTALFVGATLSVTSNSLGWSSLAGNSVIYALPEFIALLLAGAAGILPAVTATRNAILGPGHRRFLRRYLHRCTTAAYLAIGAAVLLAAAAYVEALAMGGML